VFVQLHMDRWPWPKRGDANLSRRRVHPVPTNLMRSSADVNVIGFTAGDFRRQPDPAHIARVDDRVGPVRR